ncbi:MAG: transposase [Cyanobacteriota bacterium]|nr:transposase [Cyanobacteriota bacterium]
MPRKTTSTFVTEISLIVNSVDNRELEARFHAGQQLLNAVLGEAMIRMGLVRNSEPYRQAQKLKGDDNKSQRKKLFEEARKLHRFSDFELQSFAVLSANSSKWIAQKLDSNTIQKLATRAFKAVEQVLFGKAKKIRFKTFDRFKSVEGKTNKQGLRWTLRQTKHEETIGKKSDYRNKIKCAEYVLSWAGLQLEPLIDWFDPVIAHGLNSPIKYCRLVWRRLNGKKRWFLQLINEGLPYQKPKNYVTEGLVGLDLNISNIAFVADNKAGLLPFADKAPTFEREIKAIQRKMQRTQRMHNPDNYEPDFEKEVGNKTVVKKGKVRKGKKKWNNSKNYLKLRRKKADLERRKSSYAVGSNRGLVNELLRHGNNFKTENVSVKAWHKRYGKAISAKSPGFFQSKLTCKAENAGGQLVKFSTKKTALSQTHLDGSRIKKSLSQRVHVDVTGIRMHRDIFSAYLSRFVHDELLLIENAASQYSAMEPLLVEGWEEYQKAASKIGKSEIRNSHVSAEQFSTEGLSPESATSQIVSKDDKLEVMPEPARL